MNKCLILAALLLTACQSPPPAPRLILPPEALLQISPSPAVPDAQSATQKDVAKLLLEQQQALRICAAQIQAIQDWRDSWLIP